MARSSVTGDRQVVRNLRELANRPTAKEIDEDAIASLEVLRAETAALAPRTSLKKGVVSRRRKIRSRSYREYWVAFRRGLPMAIAHLVELGTAPHSLAKGASRRKGIMQNVPPFHPGTEPEPFFTPAFEATKGEVVMGFAQRTMARLATAATRMARRR